MFNLFGSKKMKDINKYVGLYLLAYVVVLAFCFIFQSFVVCNNFSLICAFKNTEVNVIVSTTSYVLTPLVAIIGFLSWKNQYNRVTVSQLSNDIYKALDDENILAFKYRSCIKHQTDLTEKDLDLKQDLGIKSNCVYDQIRLLAKLIGNHELQELNDQHRDLINFIVLNVEIKISENAPMNEVRKKYFSNYEDYSVILRKLRSVLSNYIIV